MNVNMKIKNSPRPQSGAERITFIFDYLISEKYLIVLTIWLV